MFGKSFFAILILAIIALASQLVHAEPLPFVDRSWNRGSGGRRPPIQVPGTPPFNPNDRTYGKH